MPANENGGEDIALVLKAKIDSSMNTAVNLLDMAGDKVMELSASMDQSAGVANNFMKQLGGVGEQLKHIEKSDIGKKIVILAGAFSLATTAAFKFGQSVFKSETELRKMAKTQRKSVEATRASNVALETMGKTLKEVKADRELKSIYNELVKVNSAIAMPNAERGISAVKELRNTFWKLHGIAKYAIQSIGIRILNQLEEPIKRITDKLGSVAKWLQNNFDSVTMKISSGITAFLKGIDGIARGVTSVIEKISKINPAIMKIGSAILAVFALIKSGPLGIILSTLTMIGAVIDDAENFMYNRRYGLTEANPVGKDENGNTVRYVDTALTGLWDATFGPDGKFDAGHLAETLLDKLTDGMQNFFGDPDKVGKIGKIFVGDEGGGGLLGSVISWIDGNKDRLEKFGRTLVTFILDAVKSVGGPAGGLFGQVLDALFGEDTVGDRITEGGSGGTTFAATVGGGIGAFFKTLSTKHDFKQALLEGAGSGFLSGVFTAILSGVKDENGALKVDWDQVGDDLKAVGETVYTLFEKGLSAAEGLSKRIFTLIGNTLIPDGSDKATVSSLFGEMFAGIGNSEILGPALTDAIISGLTFKSFGAGLLGGIIGVITKAAETPDGLNILKRDINNFLNGWTELITNEAGTVIDTHEHKGFVNTFMDLMFGPLTKIDGAEVRTGGLFDSIKNVWNEVWPPIRDFIVKKWEGEDGQDGIKGVFEELWGNISEAFDKWWNGIDDRGMGTPSNQDKSLGARKRLLRLIFGDGSAKYKGIGTEIKEWFDKTGVLDTVLGLFDEIWRGKEKDGNHKGGIRAWLFGPDWDDNSEFGKSELGGIAGQFVSFFDRIVALAAQKGSEVWRAFFNSLPETIQIGLRNVTGDPNTSWVKTDDKGNPIVDDNGNVTIQSSTNREKSIPKELYDRFPGIFKYSKINSEGLFETSGSETGSYYVKEILDYIGEELGEVKKMKFFDGTPQSDLKPHLNDIYEAIMKSRESEDGQTAAEIPVGADTEEYEKKLEDAVKQGNEKKVEPKLTLDTKAAKLAIDVVASYAQKQMKIPFGFGKYSPDRYGSQGGRFNNPTNMQIAEDGTEYLIPISKPTRAMNLIRQMLGEMGASTANKLLADFGMNLGTDHIGGNYSAMTALPNGGATVTNNNNVSAPVNIYVTASGVSAEDVGERAYDAAHRQMLRTLKGVFA